MKLLIQMPIIAVPPSGQTYASILQGYNFKVIPDPTSGSKGLQITYDSISSGGGSPFPLLAMGKGKATFVPPGQTINVLASPGGTSVTATSTTGSLFLQLLPTEVRHTTERLRPIGVAPYAHIVYGHLTTQTVETAFQKIVDNLVASTAIPQAELERVAGGLFPLADLKQKYLSEFMQGKLAILVDAGADIGKAAATNPASPSPSFMCTLRYYSQKLQQLILGASPSTTVLNPEEISPVLPLRNLPNYSDQTSAIVNVWDDHPLIAQLTSQKVSFEAHLQFVVCDIRSGQRNHVPLPAGVEVALMVDDLGADTEIVKATTDSAGIVHFQVNDLAKASGEARPDIYFLVHAKGLTHAGHKLPDAWSTQGWFSTDKKTPGSYQKFVGSQIGFANAPVIFHIGVEFHFGCKYEVAPSNHDIPTSQTPSSNLFPFPKGTFITVDWGFAKRLELQADEKGEIHHVAFDISNQAVVSFVMEFEIEDLTINLQKSQVFDPFDLISGSLIWYSNQSHKIDQITYSLSEQTSVGDFGNTAPIHIKEDPRTAALYMLKSLREWSVFLHHMTGGTWKGVKNLQISVWAPASAFSWPIGMVNIPRSSYWSRGTHMHELSHQIVWTQSNVGSFDVGSRYQPTDHPADDEYSMYHSGTLYANPGHAFVEGWPAFIEALFDASKLLPDNPTKATDDLYVVDRFEFEVDASSLSGRHITKLAGRKLGPLSSQVAHFDTGFAVEGAFINALFLMFREALDSVSNVPTPASPTGFMIPESIDGDVAATAPWITNSTAQQRFMDFIYKPLGQFPNNFPTTKQYFNQVASAVNSDSSVSWDKLLAEIRIFNMFTGPPTISHVTPAVGNVGGGETITIKGDFFISKQVNTGASGFSPNTQVTIAGTVIADADVTVTDTQTLNVVTPSAVARYHGSSVDVTVKTLAGSVTQSNAFTYYASPTLLSIAPTQGASQGGFKLSVQGGRLAAGQAQVYIGSQSAAIDVTGVNTETQLTVIVPSAASSTVGTPVDVNIVTPGGTHTLPGAFTYQ